MPTFSPRQRIKYLCFLLCFLASGQLAAHPEVKLPRIVLFLFVSEAGLTDDSLEGISQNEALAQETAAYLAALAGVRSVKQVKMRDDHFDAARMQREINDFTFTPDDIVLFYYTGHGYSEGNAPRDAWPQIPATDNRKSLLFFGDLIWKKHPKALLVMADACGGLQPPQRMSRGDTPDGEEASANLVSRQQRERFKQLFGLDDPKRRVYLCLTAAEKKAYLTSKGGFFTLATHKKLKDLFRKNEPDWKDWQVDVYFEVQDEVERRRRKDAAFASLYNRPNHGSQQVIFTGKIYADAYLEKTW